MVNVDPCVTHWLDVLQFYAHDALVVSLHLVRLPSCWGFDSSKMALTRGQKSQDTQPVYYYACKAKKGPPILVYCLLYLHRGVILITTCITAVQNV